MDGKRNALGKEFLNGKLRFEGLYKNGKKHGLGKELYDDGGIELDDLTLNENLIKK